MKANPSIPRVCFVNASLPPVYGGAELAALRYAGRLADGGVGIHLIGAVAPGAAVAPNLPEWVIPIALPGGDRSPRFRLPGMAALALARRLWPKLYLMRREFDVLHVFNCASLFNLMAVPFARALGKPVVLESSLIGSDDPITLRDGRRGNRAVLGCRLRYLLYKRGSAFVAKSVALGDAYRQAHLDGGRLYRIPYAVDTELYRPADDAERLRIRRRLELPEEGCMVLFVGGYNKRKGLHWLLDAFGSVADRHPDARLIVLGPSSKYDSDYVSRLRALAEVPPLSGKVNFVDRLANNVHDYMRAVDLFVLPSEREGLPISVLESMASGLAVVASAIPEISKSQIHDGVEGRLVPVGDVGAIAKVLDELLAAPAERDRLGRAARTRALEEFSPEVVDRQYRVLYGDLLGRPIGES